MPIYVHRPTMVEASEVQDESVVINSPSGPRTARKGDFVVTVGIDGKQYPIDRSVFMKSYKRYAPGMDVYVPEDEEDLRVG